MKKIIYILIFIIIILSSALCVSLYFIMHTNNSSNGQIRAAIVESGYIKTFNKETKNILFIGNSITWHPACSYWFGSWGMAASSKDKDYVHLLINKLSKKYNVDYSVVTYASSWEANAHDRSEFLPLLDEALLKQNDYVVIQLGENVIDISNFYNDFSELIKYIRQRNKNAKLVVTGNFQFNPSEEKEIIKMKICDAEHIPYIDLSDIDNEYYYLGAKAKVYGADRKVHEVKHGGVFVHPNDKAMQVYADRIYNALMER